MKSFKDFRKSIEEGEVIDAHDRFGRPKVAAARDEEGAEAYDHKGEVVSINKDTHEKIGRDDHDLESLTRIARDDRHDDDSIHKIMDKNEPIVNQALANHQRLNSDHIHRILDSGHTAAINAAADNPGWGSDHTRRLSQMDDESEKYGHILHKIPSDG